MPAVPSTATATTSTSSTSPPLTQGPGRRTAAPVPWLRRRVNSERQPPDGSDDLVIVARALRPHGVRGEVVVEVLSDNPERLQPGAALVAAGTESDRLLAVPGRPVTVTASRPHRGRMLVRFTGVADRDDAEALRGRYLTVPRDSVPGAEPGTYYHFELVGCRCRDAAAGELGQVVDVLEDGGGVLLAVEDGERRLLVPFVAAFLRRVDVKGRNIELELPAGLIETCASTS